MTTQEKDALFEAVKDKLSSPYSREQFSYKNFIEFDVPCENADEFTQWFLDNQMGGSLMAHLNSQYGCDLYLTYNLD